MLLAKQAKLSVNRGKIAVNEKELARYGIR